MPRTKISTCNHQKEAVYGFFFVAYDKDSEKQKQLRRQALAVDAGKREAETGWHPSHPRKKENTEDG
jgi:hypothetical protein